MELGEITTLLQQAWLSSPYYGHVQVKREILITVDCMVNSTIPLYTHVQIKEQAEDQDPHVYGFREHVNQTPVLFMLWAVQLVFADYQPTEEVIQYVPTHQQGFVPLTEQRKTHAGERQERPLPDAVASDLGSPDGQPPNKQLRPNPRSGRRIG